MGKNNLPFNVKTAVICEKGQRRNVNQDMAFKKTLVVDGDIKALYAVADGIGSLSNSQTASAIVNQILQEWFKKAAESGVLNTSSEEIIQHVIEDVYYQAYDEIVEQSRADNIHMGTTLSMLLISNKQCYLFHAGDSRIYLYAADELDLLTKDDKKEDPRDGKFKLVNAIADQLPKPNVAYSSNDLYEEDLYLLMTDGGYKRNSEDYIKQVLEQASQSKAPCRMICDNLYKSALKKGETDDITLLAIFFE